ncbi:helix-turn-helix transcriptional regulator [Actinomadura gamaensis]|uniref:AAA family ATPase n=1 Tax=Actinomadura gamaensis TaxID=1763541 RepID=A0ABV9TWM3_9ACTN
MARDAGIVGRNAGIVDRDAEIAGRDAEIAGRDAEIVGRDAEIVGRDAEIERLSALVADVSGGGRALLLSGAAGTGKSTLLDDAARRAAAAGRRVLRAAGDESEKDLPFAALHQLLRPLLAEAGDLPDRQRRALLGAFGFEPGDADPLLTGVAVLSLLSWAAGRAPLLVVLDDVQWIDAASAGALSFAVRRLDGDPVAVLAGRLDGDPVALLAGGRGADGHEAATVLAGGRGGDGHDTGRALTGRFGRGVPELVLGPLGRAESRRLLDLRSPGLAAGLRERVLDEAAGNPLALLELAEAARGRRAGDAHGPLPVDERLARIYAARLAELPEAGRRALLLLAAADAADPPDTVLALLPQPDDKAWTALEESHLVRREGRYPRFRHPLIRSAVYHAEPLDARLEAHRALAAALRDEPDRRAWHLAAAALHPDAEVSAALEETAERARRRGGHAAAARALARAAELRPDREDGARLLADAAGLAAFTGDLPWVEELAARARARTGDPAVHATAALPAGRLAALTGRHAGAFPGLIAIAAERAAEDPAVALDALATAAVLRFYSGEESQRSEIARVLPSLPAGPLREWTLAVSDPFGAGRALAPRLPDLIAAARDRPERSTALAVAAWILDETPLAVRTFDEAVHAWRTHGPLPDGLGGVVALAYFEHGRWEQARTVCAELAALPAAPVLDHAVACARAIDAMVLAAQGDTASARALAGEALRLVDPLESRSVAVYAHRALASAAIADGDYETAYEYARAVFDADGGPVHYHASYPALPELAASAARSGHHADAIEIVERSARTTAGSGSSRLRSLVHRGRALLAEPEHAEPAFQAALADSELQRWPFEHAQTLLEYAEWLRRRRRIAEARPFLTAANDTFLRLGARPWAERARSESRAAGLDTGTADPGGFAGLSPQQQQIVRLAARGLSNREIGERLYLSPRTVGSHLYRTFPKLGVTARSQLRDVVDAAGDPD